MALKSNWKAPGFALFVIAAFPLIDCIPTDGGGSGGGSIDGGGIGGGGIGGGGIGGGGIDGGDVGGGDIDGGAVGGGGAGGGSGGDDFTMRGLEVGSAKNALFRFSADGTKGKKIDPGPIGSYEFSANRTRIAVDRGNDYAMGQPQRTFVFLDPDGSNSATLVFPDTSIIPNSPPSPGGGGTSLRSMLSPTGSYLAYAVQENSQQLTVYVARTDGSAPQMVLPADYNHLMGWSPVEDKLVVSTPGPLYLYDANANSLAEVTSPGVNFAGSISIWSPNGERLVFSEGGPNSYILASVNSQGLDRWDLSTDLEQGMVLGYWSPDGQTLAIPQYDSLLKQGYVRFVKVDGTMQFDFVGTQSIGFRGWTATDQFVYQQDDGAIKSITFGGQPVDLAPPDTLLSCSVLANGRVWFRRSTSYMKTINPDGSNLVTYPVPDLVGSTYSYDGNVVVVAEKPDANGIVHVYAAPTDNAQTSLILTTTQKKYYVGLMPIMDSGAIAVITEDSSFRWILPTNNGFQLIYPQIPLTSLDQAYAIPAGPF